MPGVGDADLVARQRGKIERGGNGPRLPPGHHAGAVLHHFRFGLPAATAGLEPTRKAARQHRERGEKRPTQDHGQSSIRPAKRMEI